MISRKPKTHSNMKSLNASVRSMTRYYNDLRWDMVRRAFTLAERWELGPSVSFTERKLMEEHLQEAEHLQSVMEVKYGMTK